MATVDHPRSYAMAQLRSAWSRKQLNPSTEVGWSRSYTPAVGSQLTMAFGAPGTARRVQHLMNTYGGTDESVSWIYACVSLIAYTGASYTYQFTKPGNRKQVVPTPPQDLDALVQQPNSVDTYFDWMEDVFTDLEMVGNSYWLKDQMNGLGQPNALYRLPPDRMQVVIDRQGRKAGYVYKWYGGTSPSVDIPYRLDEVIHYRTRNPLSPYYGMGTVEALIRAVETDLSESTHITAFFNNGGRITGILTSTEPMTDVQFERLVQQFQTEYSGPQNAYKILVSDGASTFQPITQSPQALGVVPLRQQTKDEILSGFGVPEFLLGGAAQAGVYKMEEAQNIFYRAMMPRARRVEERTSLDLTAAWNLHFDINAGATEPRSIRVARAKEMVGTGATLNQLLQEMDMPPTNYSEGDIPLLPGGLIPWYQAAGMDPPAAVALPGQTPGILPGLGESEGAPGGPSSGGIPRQAPASTLEQGVPHIKSVAIPELPAGYEKLSYQGNKAATSEDTQVMMDGQSAFYHSATPNYQTQLALFFTEQRTRVLDRLQPFGTRGVRNAERAKFSGSKTKQKDSMTPDALWDTEVEEAALAAVLLRLTDQYGPQAMLPAVATTGAKLAWSADDPRVQAIRDTIGQFIKGINETTRLAIQEQVEVGLRRQYSIYQIANGYASEGYKGVIGVFDAATTDRAELIARTEVARLFNYATLAAFDDVGNGEVEVIDGIEWDEGCRQANGSVWSVDRAKAEPLEHPRCARLFIAVRGSA